MGGGYNYKIPGEPEGGVKPMSITGRMVRERERLQGMTPAERAWRQKWLKDQVLTPNEPVFIKELEKDYYNPIRRFYRAPLNFIFHRVLEPYIVSI
jgi:NADH dehydrogenase (ubiquinone) 1 beta subcomplex subunit 6